MLAGYHSFLLKQTPPSEHSQNYTAHFQQSGLLSIDIPDTHDRHRSAVVAFSYGHSYDLPMKYRKLHAVTRHDFCYLLSLKETRPLIAGHVQMWMVRVWNSFNSRLFSRAGPFNLLQRGTFVPWISLQACSSRTSQDRVRKLAHLTHKGPFLLPFPNQTGWRTTVRRPL